MSEKFHPHVAADKHMREFSLRATCVGLVFGFLFGVANAYLALKIGTTVSASIPAAILSMGLMKNLFRNTTILEHNIVQTIATVGEGLAAGVVFTIPALFFLGDSPGVLRIFCLSALGGILGILFMIPMRRFIIVEEHKNLPFPEGTACAEILKSCEKTGSSALMALWGLLVAVFYKICANILYLWNEVPTWTFNFYQRATFSIDATPSLLGVGYIIGPRMTSLMFAGGLTAWWVIIPVIRLFGMGDATIIYPSLTPVAEMSSDAIWDNYVRYIGAGTVAIGGLISLGRIAPMVYRAIRVSCSELFSGFLSKETRARTDQDISMAWLILGSLAIVLVLWLVPAFPMNFFTIILLVILSFFFVAVTSLTVGLIGSSSNPVSGMTITTILITCLIFSLLGWTERIYLISAMTMGCVACVAICMAGTTSQDLKTGYLLGATPRSQQMAEILGVLIPSIGLGFTIYLMNEVYQLGSVRMPAPQATLMSIVAKGVISGNLPYTLLGIGILIGLVMALLEVPILPFALGLYLPLSLSASTMVGGLVRYFVNRKLSSEEGQERGILLASGLIGGDALTGIAIAALAIGGVIPTDGTGKWPDEVSLLLFFALGAGLLFVTARKQKERPYQ